MNVLAQPPADPPCNTIIYRTVRRASWFDPDDPSRVNDAAFMRRRPVVQNEVVVDAKDQDGLSCFDSFHIEATQCIEQERSCYGLITLHVGTLRDMGLEVIRDPQDYRKVLVTNMPFEEPEDPDMERLLDAVAGSARIHTRRKWKQPS